MIITEELTIQIVLYEESKELIFECLENLKNLKVLILDNSNNRKLREEILNKFNIKEYIILNKNLGYSKGHNYLSDKVDTKYFLILNADCKINEENIKNLLQSFKKYPDCGVISPTTFNNRFEQTYNGGPFFENEHHRNITKINGDTCFQTVLGIAMLMEKFFIPLVNLMKICFCSFQMMIYVRKLEN